MGKLRATGLSALLMVVLASTAFAQQAQTRQGFWIGGGLGYGSLGCDGCDRLGAPSGYLKLGGTLSKNLLLGMETNGWSRSELGTRLSMGNISGAVYWYPMTTNGLFVKAGAGYSLINDNLGNSLGFGMLGGVGYDVRVSPQLSVTPVANWFSGNFEGGPINVLQLGLGVTSH